MPLVNGPVDWNGVRMVVFDVDGTLYDQRALRTAMLVSLFAYALKTRSLDVPIVLQAYRACRERLAVEMATDFIDRQFTDTAIRSGRTIDDVRRIVTEWIDDRPLKILHKYRYAGIEKLFGELAERNILLAVLSDYPAVRKLRALGLSADILVSADDRDVGSLKPHPAGLAKILLQANVPPGAAIMVGDRVDRDWAVADKLGVRALIRSSRSMRGIDTFASYGDPVFPVSDEAGKGRAGARR